MKNLAVLLAAISLMPSISYGQSCFRAENGTAVFVSDDKSAVLEPAFEDYVFMLEDICAAWGFTTKDQCGIVALMGDVGLNAFATSCDGIPVIIYNRELTSLVGGDGAEFIIAHELGHHICRHFDRGTDSAEAARAQELEADRFAGASMRKMGRELDATLQITRVRTRSRVIART